MSLPVSWMVGRGEMGDDECLLCGSCVDACPSKAIRFSFRRPARLQPCNLFRGRRVVAFRAEEPPGRP
jgi:ferredoxin